MILAMLSQTSKVLHVRVATLLVLLLYIGSVTIQ